MSTQTLPDQTVPSIYTTLTGSAHWMIDGDLFRAKLNAVLALNRDGLLVVRSPKDDESAPVDQVEIALPPETANQLRDALMKYSDTAKFRTAGDHNGRITGNRWECHCEDPPLLLGTVGENGRVGIRIRDRMWMIDGDVYACCPRCGWEYLHSSDQEVAG